MKIVAVCVLLTIIAVFVIVTMRKEMSRCKIELPAMTETVNILIRTCYRPHHFAKMLQSIRSQTYKNVKLFISYDDDRALEYLNGIEATKIRSRKK